MLGLRHATKVKAAGEISLCRLLCSHVSGGYEVVLLGFGLASAGGVTVGGLCLLHLVLGCFDIRWTLEGETNK